MRFVTFLQDGHSRPGLVAGDQVIDLNLADPGLPPDMRSFLEAGPAALEVAAGVRERWADGGRHRTAGAVCAG
jgi:hypothetical protein